MLKKILVLLVIIFIGQQVLAKDVTVSVYSIDRVSTSNSNLKIGDFVTFKILNDVYKKDSLYLKKDEIVTGLITDLGENKFNFQNAYVNIEDFKVKNVDNEEVLLKGFIYKTGDNHCMVKQLTRYFGLVFIRGGEVKIKPHDTFKLYIEE